MVRGDNILKYIDLVLCLVLAAPALGTVAGLEYPVDVTIDARGGVFVADHEAHALVKLTDAGVAIVAQGEGRPRTPLYGIRHVAPLPGGGFVASDPATMKLYKIDDAGTVTAVADDDRFVTPWGVAVDDDDILAVDRVTHRLRRVKPSGAVEDIVEVKSPRAVLFDGDGAIVVLTDDNLVTVSGDTTTPITSSPPFEFPHDAVLHPDGSFYVSDGYARAIWKVTPDGNVSPLVQGEPLSSPQGLAVDREGNLLVADAHARAIFRVTTRGEVSRIDH
jgi:hypothetical protein